MVGCGANPDELRKTAQSREFIDDIARGGKTGSCKLGEGPEVAAVRARTISPIHDLRLKLRDQDPDWACDTPKAVENAHKVIEGTSVDITDEQHNAIIATAQNNGADPAESNALIDQAVRLNCPDVVGAASPLAQAVSAVCDVGEQL